MRVFVFGIGGTGARVITQLVMHLATGARPVDSNGKVLKDGFSIVPILIDPHAECDALVTLGELLNDYRKINKRLYGDGDPGKGFFSVKIQTLYDVDKNIGHDDFAFRLQNISNKSFKDFIGKEFMTAESDKFMEFLFSKEELNTEMSEGFYGSPNIGCVALNSFCESPDFIAFKNSLQSQVDKVFFIGSIFGGTGASGLPLFITNIRSLLKGDAMDSNNSGKTPIGALVVMPYFSIGEDSESPINDSDFMIKTRSALSYYESNLNRSINDVYYIADWGPKKRTNPFENDPGNKENQKGNKAHIVEFMGATAIFDYIKSDNKDVNDDGTVAKTNFKAYGIDSDDESIGTITFKEFGDGVKDLRLPYMKFLIMKHYMENYLASETGKPYASDHEPKIDASIISNTELQRIFKKVDSLMSEMGSHGTAAHNLSICNEILGKSYTNMFKNITLKEKKFFGGNVDRTSICKRLNRVADDTKKEFKDIATGEQRWFAIADIAIENVIRDSCDLK